MERNKIENTFDRMIFAVKQMLQEKLKVEVEEVKTHEYATLKVVALPEAVNKVEVYIPGKIFRGAKVNPACSGWNIQDWKMGFEQMCLEFGVKGEPRTRYLTKMSGVENVRTFANYFWKAFESMKKWGDEILEKHSEKAKETYPAKAKTNINSEDVKKAYELMRLRFACM